MENAPKNASNLLIFFLGGGGGGVPPEPPSGIGNVAPYLLLDGDSHNPSLNLDSLCVKNALLPE